jgi:hypothetical protein
MHIPDKGITTEAYARSLDGKQAESSKENCSKRVRHSKLNLQTIQISWPTLPSGNLHQAADMLSAATMTIPIDITVAWLSLAVPPPDVAGTAVVDMPWSVVALPLPVPLPVPLV